MQGGERPRPPAEEVAAELGGAQVLTFTNMASRLALSPRGTAQLSCSLARLMPVAQCSSSSWLWQHCSWTILWAEGAGWPKGSVGRGAHQAVLRAWKQ